MAKNKDINSNSVNLNYEAPKPNWLMKQFWKAAGADEFILSHSTYSDQVKYFCLGGIVIATAFMASISGGYAFYTIFKPKQSNVSDLWTMDHVTKLDNLSGYVESTDWGTVIISVLFGIFWGLIIYNLDRFIVASTGGGDGTEAITWSEFKTAIPRILMGCIIALSISKPLEVRILKGELDQLLSSEQATQRAEEKKKVEDKFTADFQEIDQNLKPYVKKLDDNQAQWDELQSLIQFETKNGGCRDKCEENKSQQRKIEEVKKTILNDPRYIDLNKSKEDLEQERKNEIKQVETDASLMDGLAIRIKLAEEHYPTISLFLTLLFLAIELTPIFFKLMLIKSPYNYLTDNYKAIELAENGIYVDENYYEDKKGVQRELVRYLNAEKDIKEKKELYDAQLRIFKHAVEKFEEQEKENINKNPDDYVKYT